VHRLHELPFIVSPHRFSEVPDVADMVFVYDGKKETLLDIINLRYSSGTWRLFQNDIVPDEDTVEADLVQADYAGYAGIFANWGAVVADAFGRATSLDDLHTFTCTGGGVTNIIYGIYFYDDTGSKLQFVYRFPEPISMAVAGDTIPFRGKLLDGNLAPP